MKDSDRSWSRTPRHPPRRRWMRDGWVDTGAWGSGRDWFPVPTYRAANPEVTGLISRKLGHWGLTGDRYTSAVSPLLRQAWAGGTRWVVQPWRRRGPGRGPPVTSPGTQFAGSTHCGDPRWRPVDAPGTAVAGSVLAVSPLNPVASLDLKSGNTGRPFDSVLTCPETAVEEPQPLPPPRGGRRDRYRATGDPEVVADPTEVSGTARPLRD